MKIKKIMSIMMIAGVMMSGIATSGSVEAASKHLPGIVYTQGTKFVLDTYPLILGRSYSSSIRNISRSLG